MIFTRNPEVLKVVQNHRSVRHFTNQKIPTEDLQEIIRSAQAAASSSHGQAYSIICVTDPEKKKLLAEYAGGQQHVETCSHFLVFCADLYRLEQIARRRNVDLKESLDSTEMFIIATVDAALAAQNTAIAAEALGYGIVYIGGLRNNPYEVSALLNLPYRVYPVFGMCLGIPDPDKVPNQKPRLPREAVFFENVYKPFEETEPFIQQYDEVMKAYYSKRKDGNRDDTWSNTITDKRKVPRRMHMKQFLQERGFLLT